jgi:hypothetical protein
MITYYEAINYIENYYKKQSAEKLLTSLLKNYKNLQESYLIDTKCEHVPEELRALYQEIRKDVKESSLEIEEFRNSICLREMQKKGVDISIFPKGIKEIIAQLN